MTLLAQLVSVLLRLASIIVLARLLAPDVFGLIAIAASLSTLATAIVFLGLPTALAQAPNLSRRAASSLALVNSGLGLAFGVLLFLVAPWIAALYGEPVLVPIVQWLAVVPVLNGVNVAFRQELIRRLRFGALSLSELLAQLAGIAAAIAVAALGGTYEAVVCQLVVNAAIQLLIAAALSRWIPTRFGDWRTEVVPVLRVGLNVFGMSAVRNVCNNVLAPVMGLFVSASNLGQFDRAQQLTSVPITMSVDQLQRVVVPVLSRLRAEPVRMLAYFQRAQLLGGYGTSTLFLVAAALSPTLVEVLLGSDWREAGEVLQILAVGAVGRACGQSMQWMFIAAERTGAGFRLQAWALPVVTAVSLGGLPWGILGVAIASSIAWLGYWPIAAIALARTLGIRPTTLLAAPLRGVLGLALPAALAALASRLFLLPAWTHLLIGLAAALTVVVIISLVVPPVRRDLRLAADALRLALPMKGGGR